MYPLLISGIASVASKAIDAWQNVAAQRNASVPVSQARFDNAFGQAMGSGTSFATPTVATTQPTAVQSLTSQLRNAPEISSVLNAQDPSNPGSVQVSEDGRVFLQVPGRQPTELAVSQDTQNLARQLGAAMHNTANVSAAYNRSMSSMSPSTGSLVTLTR